jgi:RHS repeat-associated protein
MSPFLPESYDGSVFAYTGRYTDTMTGLQWNLHRWYDPTAGRWMREDPIGFSSARMPAAKNYRPRRPIKLSQQPQTTSARTTSRISPGQLALLDVVQNVQPTSPFFHQRGQGAGEKR